MEIYITRDGQQYGPYTKEDVLMYLKKGNFTTTDLAWYDGAVDWLPLATIFKLPPDQSSLIYVRPSSAQTAQNTVQNYYTDIPWFRRSGTNTAFIIIGLLFPPFIWAVCFISLTGDVYYKNNLSDGMLKKWSAGNKGAAIILLVIQLVYLYDMFHK